jgi:phenylalanyl-tRNA synthetase beta subunit
VNDIAFVVDQEVAVVTVLEIERGVEKEVVRDEERGGKREVWGKRRAR